MEWIFIFGLCFGLFLQSRRITALSVQVGDLLKKSSPGAAAPTQAAEAPVSLQELITAPAPEAPIAPVFAPAAAVAPEPVAPIAPPPSMTPEELAKFAAETFGTAARTAEEAPHFARKLRPAATAPFTETPAPRVEKPAPPPRKDSRALERWLSEDGLAWLGGGALALGGMFLVAYAAQRGFFTPLMRLIAAVFVGGLLIGASEWVRRFARTDEGAHAPIAALLAGAGAGTLYAASWGAFGLYHYIEWPAAAAALTVCSALLLGLALLHGEAIGVLAILAAIAAPGLTGKDVWPADAVSLYVLAVCVTGYLVAAMRRWGWVAGATLVGAYVWYAISIADGVMFRGIALLTLSALGGCGMALVKSAAGPPQPTPAWSNAQRALPPIAIGLSSFLLLIRYPLAVGWAEHALMPLALSALLMVVLATLAVRARLASASVQAVAIAALTIGFVIYLLDYSLFSPLRGHAREFYSWALTAAVGAGVCALAATMKLRGPERGLASAAGVVGVIALLFVAAFSQADLRSLPVLAAMAGGAVLLALAAQIAARTAEDATRDTAVDLWAGGSVLALLWALEAAAPRGTEVVAAALTALVIAAMHWWCGWRVLPGAAATVAAIALGHAFSSHFAGEAFAGILPLQRAVPLLAAAAAALLGAAWLVRRRAPESVSGDSLGTASLLIALLAAFLVMHRFAVGGLGLPLDAFTEISLHTLLFLVAGFAVMPRAGRHSGPIARVRGHVLFGGGLLFGTLTLVTALNPWWGVSPALTVGPPLLSSLTLAFGAPALLTCAAASRLYKRAPAGGRVYAIFGAMLAVLWAAMEIRHAFHGAGMSMGAVGLLEAHAYALAALVLAGAQLAVTRLRSAHGLGAARPFSSDLVRTSGGVTIGALAVAGFIMGVLANAWWGKLDPVAANDIETLLAVASVAAAGIISLCLAYQHLERARTTRHAAAFVAMMFGLLFGVLFIRWAHHGGEMHDGPPLSGLEGLIYAVWPVVFAILFVSAQKLLRGARGEELASIFARMVSTLVWTTLGFMAFGLLVLFAPWWGAAPAQVVGVGTALGALGAYFAAAWLSLRASALGKAEPIGLFAKIALVSCVAHLFAAATLIVRRLFRGGDMSATFGEASLETWTYSAVWAALGAAVLLLGAFRRDVTLRWLGLGVLLITTAKVFLIDMARLDGVIRAASFLGLGAVLVGIALAIRRAPSSDVRTAAE